jgi:phage shock protein C
MASGQLTRSTSDKRLGGVAGGIAAYFGIDATLVRVAWVIAGAMGWGILAYILLWIVLPEGTAATPAIRVAEERYARGEIDSRELERIRRDLETRP